MIKYHVSVVQEKTTILWRSYIILAYAMDQGEREEREVKD
jgi:hypothetical protein